MTMLIAGHETTAAVLTWALFSLVESPEKMRKAVAEVDAAGAQRSPAAVSSAEERKRWVRYP